MKLVSRWASYSDTYKSATALRLGIDNEPTDEALDSMRILCFKVYDPLCDYFGRRLPINSMYRSITLNTKIGGSRTSQHCKGEAIDIDCDSLATLRINNALVFDYVRKRLDFDQLIWEFGDDKRPDWVHVSYNAGRNRREVLRARKGTKGQTLYTPYTPTP
jgi:zinc D-Ala-D-Ala carboxypeptidase